MIEMSVSQAAGILHAQALGDHATCFRGCGIDTRSLKKDMLFVALNGEHVDGHRYFDQARDNGAAAVLTETTETGNLPGVQVNDTRIALGNLMAGWRQQFDLPVIAVTGSNGKTTVKELLASVLRKVGPTLVTEGNLNNDLGLPLTLSRLAKEHQYAVLEMGANHPGEIARLAEIGRPVVGIVTQCAAAHLQGFGNLEGVAYAKGELFESLPENGIAVINADDQYADLWRELAGPRTIISFGLDRPADVSATWQENATGSFVQLKTPAGECTVQLHLPGQHNVMNLLAATAALLAIGLSLAVIASGLESAKSVKGRLQSRAGLSGSHLLDDTYNANPESLRAGLTVLAGMSGQRWLVLGDMGELGADSLLMHRQAGELARELGIDKVFTTGTFSEECARGFGQQATHFTDRKQMIAELRSGLDVDTTVLIKGSRLMQMDEIVDALAEVKG